MALSNLYRLLSRETSGGKVIPQVDGLRFVAIAAVLAFHINSHSQLGNWVCAEGHTGVPLFFVLSGFVLALPFAKQYSAEKSGEKPIELKRYLIRRLVRIEPPYLVALTIVMLVSIYDGSSFLSLLPHWVASAFYCHYFVFGRASFLGVAWSLEIEAQFYLLAPLLAYVFWIRNTIVRRLIIVVVMLTCGGLQSLVDYPHQPMHGWTIASALHWFAAGFLLADFYVRGGLKRSMVWFVWDLLGICAWVGLWWIVYLRFYIHVLAPLVMLIAYASAFKGRVFSMLLSLPPVTMLGGMCYTIYLYHYLIIYVATRTLQLHGWVLLIPILSVSVVLFVLFEKPFMSKALSDRFTEWLESG